MGRNPNVSSCRRISRGCRKDVNVCIVTRWRTTQRLMNTTNVQAMQLFCKIIFVTLLTSFSLTSFSQNTLSEQEKKEGWILLFDGNTTSGWRNFNSDKISSRWKVSNGELYLDKSVTEGAGDIVTDDEYKDFEFMIEWKIAACGNSGIIFNV